MTFQNIKNTTTCRPVAPQYGSDFFWHKKEFWLVHGELKWAYWMGEWEVKTAKASRAKSDNVTAPKGGRKHASKNTTRHRLFERA